MADVVRAVSETLGVDIDIRVEDSAGWLALGAAWSPRTCPGGSVASSASITGG